MLVPAAYAAPITTGPALDDPDTQASLARWRRVGRLSLIVGVALVTGALGLLIASAGFTTLLVAIAIAPLATLAIIAGVLSVRGEQYWRGILAVSPWRTKPAQLTMFEGGRRTEALLWIEGADEPVALGAKPKNEEPVSETLFIQDESGDVIVKLPGESDIVVGRRAKDDESRQEWKDAFAPSE